MSEMSNPTPTRRLFRIGSTIISESPSTQGLSTEQVRQRLKSAYPEITHASIRETRDGDTLIVDFTIRAGHKG